MRGRVDLAPKHYERLGLQRPVRAGMWIAAALLVSAALALSVGFQGSASASVGAGILGAAGAIAVVAVYRLGECEVRVTKVAMHVGFGPLSAVYPLWGVRPVRSQPATSWRRRYAPSELVVELDDPRGPRELAVPTREPEDLSTTLTGLRKSGGPA